MLYSNPPWFTLEYSFTVRLFCVVIEFSPWFCFLVPLSHSFLSGLAIRLGTIEILLRILPWQHVRDRLLTACIYAAVRSTSLECFLRARRFVASIAVVTLYERLEVWQIYYNFYAPNWTGSVWIEVCCNLEQRSGASEISLSYFLYNLCCRGAAELRPKHYEGHWLRKTAKSASHS